MHRVVELLGSLKMWYPSWTIQFCRIWINDGSIPQRCGTSCTEMYRVSGLDHRFSFQQCIETLKQLWQKGKVWQSISHCWARLWTEYVFHPAVQSTWTLPNLGDVGAFKRPSTWSASPNLQGAWSATGVKSLKLMRRGVDFYQVPCKASVANTDVETFISMEIYMEGMDIHCLGIFIFKWFFHCLFYQQILVTMVLPISKTIT